MKPFTQSAALAVVALMTCTSLRAQSTPRIDNYDSRLEVLALMQTLNADILASSSATKTLESWCRDHDMAEDPKVVAQLVPGPQKPPSAEQLQRLQVTDAAEVRYRHVELRCGTHVLSEADNWYVPARLTPEMNRLLETTDTPFGRAVQELHPYRRTFAVTILWSPLPPGWEQRPARRTHAFVRRPLAIPKELFAHRAVLYTATHEPFSEVSETYQGEVLDFPRTRPATDRR
jgi:chorismate-pyruvate lyase